MIFLIIIIYFFLKNFPIRIYVYVNAIDICMLFMIKLIEMIKKLIIYFYLI